jgi:SAM-dependent methyltransferase
MIIGKKANRGFCPICEKKTIFIKYDSWLRDHYKCKKCQSIPRQRALINALNIFFPGYPHLNIHESSPSGASSDFIKNKCKGYTYSQYFLDVDTGSYKNGIRCENVEKLTFPDDTFDLFITQDVVEHVMHPDQAFKEIKRVLKPGGAHVFTVGMFRNLEKTRPRVVEIKGKLNYLLEAQYHDNPIAPGEGSLVTYDYGIDLPDYIYEQCEMYTTIFLIKDIKLGLDGEFLEVFISKNTKNNNMGGIKG